MKSIAIIIISVLVLSLSGCAGSHHLSSSNQYPPYYNHGYGYYNNGYYGYPNGYGYQGYRPDYYQGHDRDAYTRRDERGDHDRDDYGRREHHRDRD